MFRKLRTYIREFKLTMKMKLVLSLSSIVVILLVSTIPSMKLSVVHLNVAYWLVM